MEPSLISKLVQILRSHREQTREIGDLKAYIQQLSDRLDNQTDDPVSPTQLSHALEHRGDCYLEIEHFTSANQDYQAALESLASSPDATLPRFILHAKSALAYDGINLADSASQHWQLAADLGLTLSPDTPLDMIQATAEIGRFFQLISQFNLAESLLLRSLELSHSLLGPDDLATAAAFHQLGHLYQDANYHEQAREMLLLATDIRIQQLGEEHPDTAESHKRLACALAATGDRSWARRHFEKALAGFESLGSDYFSELQTTSDLFCNFLNEAGEAPLAETIAKRVIEVIVGKPRVLAKPL